MSGARTNTTGPGSRYVNRTCTAPKTGRHKDEETRLKCPKCGGTNIDKANALIAKAPSLGDGVTRTVNTNGANAHIETRDAQGKLHSVNDEPSVIVLRPDGSRKRAEWHRHGKKHRDGGKPAGETYVLDTNGVESVQKRLYYENGVKGRSSDGLGSERRNVNTGEVTSKEWCNTRGRVTREESRLYYGSSNFKVRIGLFDENGKPRLDGPNTVTFNDDGSVAMETYYHDYGELSDPKANAYAYFLIQQGLIRDDSSTELLEYLAESVQPGHIGEGTFRVPSDEELFVAKTVFGQLES